MIKNILFVSVGVNPTKGGVERVTYNLATSFKKNGVASWLCSTSKFGDENEICTPFEQIVYLERLTKQYKAELIDIIIKNEIKLVINQQGTNLKLVSYLRDICDIACIPLYSVVHISPTASTDVLHYRDLRFPKYVIRSILKELLYKVWKFDVSRGKKIYVKSDKVILLTSDARTEYSKLLKLKEDDPKLFVVSNSVCDGEGVLDLSLKKNVFIVVSRMGEPVKRISLILDSWGLVQDKLADWRLVLVGDGTDLNSYKDITKKKKLRRVDFVGETSPNEYYKIASIFLMTSVSEGFGMTILEAQQSGVVPIVTNSFSSLKTLINDGETGIICKKRSPECFGQLMIELANNKTLRETIAENAFKSTKRFSSEKIYKKWEEVL